MTITRWIPRKSLLDYHNEIGRLFDNVIGPRQELDRTNCQMCPQVDIEEHDKEYRIFMELPGVKKSDIKIKIDDDMLKITGEKKADKDYKDKNLHKSERMYGSFERNFRLPELVDQENIVAEFKDGILNVSIPKREDAQPKQLDIKVH